ncbi:MAG: uncharacterized protein KVP18_002324 [Porospora cf. gigantea A]|uniref:uncharacterized protein n=1 Tax=Porospora cf. gigantea A TaxID=2853593 RepID=UPI003559D77E|nr:MAG: hypothetical protein KVP18_002324 [Porospora cf. gigantea A]
MLEDLSALLEEVNRGHSENDAADCAVAESEVDEEDEDVLDELDAFNRDLQGLGDVDAEFAQYLKDSGDCFDLAEDEVTPEGGSLAHYEQVVEQCFESPSMSSLHALSAAFSHMIQSLKSGTLSEADDELTQGFVSRTLETFPLLIEAITFKTTMKREAVDEPSRTPSHRHYPSFFTVLPVVKSIVGRTLKLVEDLPPRVVGEVLLPLADPLVLKWFVVTPQTGLRLLKDLSPLLFGLSADMAFDKDSVRMLVFVIFQQTMTLVVNPEFHCYSCVKSPFKKKVEEIAADVLEKRKELAVKAYLRVLFTQMANHLPRKVASAHHSCMMFIVNAARELLSAVWCESLPALCAHTLREYAIHMRKLNSALSLSAKTKTAAKKRTRACLQHETAVFSWKFLATMRVWLEITFKYKQQADVSQLHSQLINLVLAATRLYTSSVEMLPFRLQALRMLTDTMAEQGTFISVGASLLGLLNDIVVADNDNLRNAKSRDPSEVLTEIDWLTALKIPKHARRAARVTSNFVGLATATCAGYLATLSQHPSFPEVSFPMSSNLRRVAKTSLNDVARKDIKRLAAACDTTSQKVKDTRAVLRPEDLPFGKLLILDVANEVRDLDRQLRHNLERAVERSFKIEPRVKEEIKEENRGKRSRSQKSNSEKGRSNKSATKRPMGGKPFKKQSQSSVNGSSGKKAAPKKRSSPTPSRNPKRARR